LGGNKQLSKKAQGFIADIDNAVYLSIASLWEMSIKKNIKKLKLP
jgi:PIN domain nuclease of toxin-antitoxin system